MAVQYGSQIVNMIRIDLTSKPNNHAKALPNRQQFLCN